MTRVKRLSSFSIFSFYLSDFLCVESNHSVTLLIPKCVNERISHHMDHDQFEVALQLMVSILDFSTLKPLACWVKISADDILKCFSYFSRKIGFDTLCKLPLKKTICMNLFVCAEVLRPSQPSGVMSSAVSLLNHPFTGQA